MPGFADENGGATATERGRGVLTPAAPAEPVETLDSTDLKNRDIRQRGILDPKKLANIEVIIVGVGAIGHQIARSVAQQGGVRKVTIWDHDTVGTENLAPQGFTEGQVGQHKVKAVADEMKALNSTVPVEAFPNKLRNSWLDSIPIAKAKDSVKRVLFVAVDNMDTRRAIYESHRNKFHAIVDTRMNAEVLRVIAYSPQETHFDYNKTLFTEQEALQGTCTTRSLSYTSNIAAGLAMHRMSQVVRGLPLTNDVLLDLSAGLLQDLTRPSGFAEDEDDSAASTTTAASAP